MEQRPDGTTPGGEGWFVVNARDAEWLHNERFGAGVIFESVERRFPHYGINAQVLRRGQPNGYYHAEDGQEDFLILSGERVLLIEGEERRLTAWDFVHCPPGTHRIFVCTGDRPCALLAVGARNAGDGIVYPVSDLAVRHGAGTSAETTDPAEAYAGVPETTAGPYAGGLPGDE
jgi:uncharacterized cupin superfamily protein